jgi:dTDP-4-dehydrorhamnose 3,5-epimerase
VLFTPLELEGAYVVDLERRDDERGFFARTWCANEFAEHGLSTDIVQCNLSFNRRRATLRGMHFQREPHAEAKLIRCTRGAIYDAIIDLRPESPTYLRWIGVDLTADNRRALYVPEGFAHGYQTLVDDTETFYQVSEFYSPGFEDGVRWNDPAFGIEWPYPDAPLLSAKDASWPDYQP